MTSPAEDLLDAALAEGLVDIGPHWHYCTRVDLIELIERAYLAGRNSYDEGAKTFLHEHADHAWRCTTCLPCPRQSDAP